MSFINNLDLSPQLAFSLAIEKDYSVLYDYLGINTVNFFKQEYGNNIRFIEDAIDTILTEARHEKPKYKDWFDNHAFARDPKEFSIIFKFIGLALSGQLPDYKIENPVNYMYRVGHMKVDYSDSPYKDSKSIEKVIATILFGICGIPSYSGPDKLSTL